MFDTSDRVRTVARARNWRLGEFIAELVIPDDAPIMYSGPDRKGHWLLYDADGNMLVRDSVAYLLDYVVRVVHGPSHTT